MFENVKIINIAADGCLIGKCRAGIPNAANVKHLFNNRKNRIASIRKVFGSIDAPYIKASLFQQYRNSGNWVGKQLFIK